MIDTAMNIFRDLRKTKLKRDAFMYTVLLNGVTDSTKFDHTDEILRAMQEDQVTLNIVLANTLMKLYCSNGQLERAVSVYNDMDKSELTPDTVTYTVLLNGCIKAAEFDRGIQLYHSMLEKRIVPDIEIQNTMLKLLCTGGMFDQADSMFTEMKANGYIPTAATYTILLSGYTVLDRVQALYQDYLNNKRAHTVQLFSLFIKQFCSFKRIELAMTVLQNMKDAGITPDEVTYNILISGCTVTKNFVVGEQLHQEMGKTKSIQVATSLIKMYSASGDFDTALHEFNTIDKHGVDADETLYNVMLSACTQHGRFDIADSLIQQMNEQRISVNVEIATTLIKQYSMNGRLDKAKILFQNIRTAATYAALLNGCIISGDFEYAERLCLESVELTSELLNAKIKFYCASHKLDKALEIVFRNSDLTNTTSFTILLNGCLVTEEFSMAEKVLDMIRNRSMEHSIELSNTIIKYFCRMSQLEEAFCTFKQLPVIDTVTVVILLNGCIDAGEYAMGDSLVNNAKRRGIQFSLEIENSILKLLCDSNRLDEAFRYYKRMPLVDSVTYTILITACTTARVFDQIETLQQEVKNCIAKPSVELLTCLIKANSCMHRYDIAQKIFSEMQEPNEYTFNTMIYSYIQQDAHERAFELAARITLTWNTYELLLTSAQALGFCQDTINRIEQYENKKSFEYSVLMLCYAYLGEFETVDALFESVTCRDINVYNSMMYSFSLSGNSLKAIKLLDRIATERVTPNEKTYVLVLNACRHAGLVKEAEEIYNYLVTHKKVTDAHTSCLIDAYARWNQLDKAENLVLKLKAKDVGWVTVLGGCKKFSDIERAERVFDNVTHLASAYLLLGNIYSSNGMLEKAIETRSEMEKRGLMKLPGRSSVKVDDISHTFHVEDPNTPTQVVSILQELRKAISKEYGYVPDVSCVMKNVPSYDAKVEHLWLHSEKIALGFALWKKQDKILITSNLRMCLDCHSVMKLVSLHLTKKIIMKDTKRIHVIEKGTCSCKDHY
jgi:pentatricopeptide repeat protein